MTTEKSFSKLDSPLLNILTILVTTVGLFALYLRADFLKDAGMAAIFLNWIPVLIGLFTMVLYGISRIFTKKRNWILTLIGIGLNVFYVISALFSG